MCIATDKCHQPTRIFLACSLNICSKTAQFLFLESSQEEGSREDECDTLTKVFLTTSICGVCIN